MIKYNISNSNKFCCTNLYGQFHYYIKTYEDVGLHNVIFCNIYKNRGAQNFSYICIEYTENGEYYGEGDIDNSNIHILGSLNEYIKK